MKPALFLAFAAVAASAAPALADNGQVFDYGAQSRAYPAGEPVQNRQCFNGAAISGVSRAGGTLYVQSSQGGIYNLRLADACTALGSAQKISVRAEGGDAVCDTGRAQVVVQTAAGPLQCAISQVRKVGPKEAARLADAGRR